MIAVESKTGTPSSHWRPHNRNYFCFLYWQGAIITACRTAGRAGNPILYYVLYYYIIIQSCSEPFRTCREYDGRESNDVSRLFCSAPAPIRTTRKRLYSAISYWLSDFNTIFTWSFLFFFFNIKTNIFFLIQAGLRYDEWKNSDTL